MTFIMMHHLEMMDWKAFLSLILLVCSDALVLARCLGLIRVHERTREERP